MGDLGVGMFEIAGEDVGRNPERQADYFGRLSDLAVETGVPMTFGVASGRVPGNEHRVMLDLLDSSAALGGRMIGQAHAREFNLVLSFKTQVPFDALPEWKDLRSWPLDEQQRALRDPSVARAPARRRPRRRMAQGRRGGGPQARLRLDPASWTSRRRRTGPSPRSPPSGASTRPSACSTSRVDSDLDQFFLQPILNGDQDVVLEIMQHPRCIPTFSDSGAHVTQLMDSSIPTHFLGHWTREREAFTLEEAIRKLTCLPATAWGFHDRGLVREGMAADLCVFDPATIGPAMPEVASDLPAGAQRLVQKAHGIAATVVNGEVRSRTGRTPAPTWVRCCAGPLARGLNAGPPRPAGCRARREPPSHPAAGPASQRSPCSRTSTATSADRPPRHRRPRHGRVPGYRPLPPDALRRLRYMHDVEHHTALLPAGPARHPAHQDPTSPRS